MRISEAMRWLRSLESKHGDIEVYFDCPRCGTSYPTKQVQPVVHMQVTDGKEPASPEEK